MKDNLKYDPTYDVMQLEDEIERKKERAEQKRNQSSFKKKVLKSTSSNISQIDTSEYLAQEQKKL